MAVKKFVSQFINYFTDQTLTTNSSEVTANLLDGLSFPLTSSGQISNFHFVWHVRDLKHLVNSIASPLFL